MKTRHLSNSRAGWIGATLLSLIASPLAVAEQFELFTYTVDGDEVTITDYPKEEGGEVEIPAEIDGKPVTTIGPYAFNDCAELTGITIPSSVTTLERSSSFRYSPFAGCTMLQSIRVADGSGHFSSREGVLFDLDAVELLQFPPGRNGTYAIPDGVTSIGPYAFLECGGLTGVSLPQGLTSIGPYAFLECGGLPGVSLPEGLTSIGRVAFGQCSGLTNIAIPEGVTTVNPYTFDGCTSLAQAELPSSLSNIGQGAFLGCGGLTHIDIPPGVVMIGDWAFSRCSSLDRVVIPQGVTSIGRGPFANCLGLQEILVDEGNTHYLSLDGVLFSSGLSQLLQVPATRTGDYAIPSGVIEVGSAAFSSCTGLTHLSIPASVTQIAGSDRRDLRDLVGLQSISVSPESSSYVSEDGVLFTADRSELLRYPAARSGPYSVPAGVTTIRDYAFFGAAGLTEISLLEGLRQILWEAFAGCDALTVVTLPTTLADPRPRAFADCAQLRTLIVTFYDQFASLSHKVLEGSPNATVYFLRARLFPQFGYPYVVLDLEEHPAAVWLLQRNLPHDSDLNQDLNSDGVNLLMAYALDLDPSSSLQAFLPFPAISPDGQSMSMSFHATSPGVTYRVETSTDLENWTTEGVVLSDVGPDARRTATVLRDGPRRFLQLVVEN